MELEQIKKEMLCNINHNFSHDIINADTIEKLMDTIKQNFYYYHTRGIITVSLIEKYKSLFNDYCIYANEDTNGGYVICNKGTIEVSGYVAIAIATNDACIEAYGEAIVYAEHNSTIYAFRNTKIYARDNCIVYAYDKAKVKASNFCNITLHDFSCCISYYKLDNVVINDQAIYKVFDTNTIYISNS